MGMTQVLIVGAGPYGLSLANYLSAQGQDFRIIGKPMELWKNHIFSKASLRSDMATSEIAHPEQAYTIQAFRAATDTHDATNSERVSVREYRQYIDWVLADLPYKIESHYLVHLSKEKDHYLAELSSGDVIVAKRVIIATGVAHHLNIPEEFKASQNTIHSYQVPEIEVLKDKKVLVVGAGQSAAEAIEVCQQNNNQVEWYCRTEPRFYSEPLDLPKWIFDLVVKSAGFFRRLPSGLIKSVFSIFSATTMTPDYKVKLADIKRYSETPTLTDYDHIIVATGYRYSLKHMAFLGAEVSAMLKMKQDMPQIDKNFMSSLKNLYFIGPTTEQFFGPPMKFMIGSQYVAPRLSKILAG
jgi:lysine/ornithine N-monooxygenase